MIEAGAAIGASRLTVGGDSADFSVVAEKLAEMCELAQPYGIAVDLEFMPFRPVQSLAHAVDVLKRAKHPNAHILIDALHVFRSKSAIEQFAEHRSGDDWPIPDLRCARDAACRILWRRRAPAACCPAMVNLRCRR